MSMRGMMISSQVGGCYGSDDYSWPLGCAKNKILSELYAKNNLTTSFCLKCIYSMKVWCHPILMFCVVWSSKANSSREEKLIRWSAKAGDRHWSFLHWKSLCTSARSSIMDTVSAHCHHQPTSKPQVFHITGPHCNSLPAAGKDNVN